MAVVRPTTHMAVLYGYPSTPVAIMFQKPNESFRSPGTDLNRFLQIAKPDIAASGRQFGRNDSLDSYHKPPLHFEKHKLGQGRSE